MFEPRFLHVFKDDGKFDDSIKSHLETLLNEQQIETSFKVVIMPAGGLLIMFDTTNMSLGARYELQSTAQRCVEKAMGQTDYALEWLDSE